MSTYETRPGGMAGAPVRASASSAMSRKQRVLEEARAEGDEIEERDGKVTITHKGARKAAKR
jgi:hypothetical protein